MRVAGLSSVTWLPSSSVTVIEPEAADAAGEAEAVVPPELEPQAASATTPSARTATRRSAAVRRPKRVAGMVLVAPFRTWRAYADGVNCRT